MLEDSNSAKRPKSALEEETILEWMVESRVLSIALEGNLPSFCCDNCYRTWYVAHLLVHKSE